MSPVAKPVSTRPWARRIARGLALFALLPYLTVTAFFAVLQRTFIYQPARAKHLAAAELGLESDFIQDVRLSTPDGEMLHGWLFARPEAEEPDRPLPPLVIYFPGNAGNRLDRLSELRQIAAAGFDALIFDYRGYGDSTGRPSESALSGDARLVWEFACRQLGRPAEQIVLFGESLGGAVALSLWSSREPSQPRPAAVILKSTFTRLTDVAAWHYPYFPTRWLLVDRWPSLERIGRVESPITIFHGTADEVTPVSHAHTLAAAARQARLIVIPDGTHNELPSELLREELERLGAAIAKAN